MTPYVSFWDSDNVYFNLEEYDKHGSYYDNDYNYIHCEGWDDIKGCYKGEILNDNFNKDDIFNKLYEKNKGIEVLDGGEESIMNQVIKLIKVIIISVNLISYLVMIVLKIKKNDYENNTINFDIRRITYS